MIQEALFETQDAIQPPKPPKPVAVAEPLGVCCKLNCEEPAVLKSPSGMLYCSKHGYCARRTCLRSVEKFVWHERMERYVCPCVKRFDEKIGGDDDGPEI